MKGEVVTVNGNVRYNGKNKIMAKRYFNVYRMTAGKNDVVKLLSDDVVLDQHPKIPEIINKQLDIA